MLKENKTSMFQGLAAYEKVSDVFLAMYIRDDFVKEYLMGFRKVNVETAKTLTHAIGDYTTKIRNHLTSH